MNIKFKEPYEYYSGSTFDTLEEMLMYVWHKQNVPVGCYAIIPIGYIMDDDPLGNNTFPYTEEYVSTIENIINAKLREEGSRYQIITTLDSFPSDDTQYPMYKMSTSGYTGEETDDLLDI